MKKTEKGEDSPADKKLNALSFAEKAAEERTAYLNQVEPAPLSSAPDWNSPKYMKKLLEDGLTIARYYQTDFL